jgi:hypothetical protein
MEFMQLNVDEMSITELRGIIKMLVRVINDDFSRIDVLQDRVLQLEMKILKGDGE